MVAPGDKTVPGGFQRVTRAPPPSAVSRLRDDLALLARGRPEHVRRGLCALQQWDNLALLCSGPWFSDVLRSPGNARWTLERRLTLLGTPQRPLSEALQAPPGTVVKLAGTARFLHRSGSRSTSPIGILWKNSTRRALDVCHFVEEGQDLVLHSGVHSIAVLAEGGHLVRGDRLADGDAAEVLGYVDRVVDPAVASGSRMTQLRPVIRSGDQLSLLIWGP